MASNSLWQQAVDWWAGRQNAGGSGGGSGEPVKATKREKFDKEFDLAKRKYERGWYDALEYRDELRRLRRVYKFRPLSDPGMALFRELERVNDDIDDLTKDLPAKGDGPDKPSRDPNWMPGGPDRQPGGGGSSRMGGGGSGVTLVINAPNAVMVDRKAIQEVFDRYAPQINKALAKYRNGAG
jgi:hypothetical protein